MIRLCDASDAREILAIINEAAVAYRGAIPADCWHEPYMSDEQLTTELGAGVEFIGWTESNRLAGVMGRQDVHDATLIRHAYVRPSYQGRGIGGKLLATLVSHASKPVLIGTWAAASWAIRFYEHHGFQLASAAETAKLLNAYWAVSSRQRDVSVVLRQSRRPGLS